MEGVLPGLFRLLDSPVGHLNGHFPTRLGESVGLRAVGQSDAPRAVAVGWHRDPLSQVTAALSPTGTPESVKITGPSRERAVGSAVRVSAGVAFSTLRVALP